MTADGNAAILIDLRTVCCLYDGGIIYSYRCSNVPASGNTFLFVWISCKVYLNKIRALADIQFSNAVTGTVQIIQLGIFRNIK